MHLRFLLLLTASSVLLWGNGGRKVFRLEGELLYAGDSKYEIIAKLGQPYGTLEQTKIAFIPNPTGEDHRTYTTVETWLYNFGSRRFSYRLLFQNNRLEKVLKGPYGFDYPERERCSLSGTRVDLGDIDPEILMKCGEPNFKDAYYEDRIVKTKHGTQHLVTVHVEEWTYNFGPNKFMTILRLEDGVLVDYFKGKYGF